MSVEPRVIVGESFELLVAAYKFLDQEGGRMDEEREAGGHQDPEVPDQIRRRWRHARVSSVQEQCVLLDRRGDELENHSPTSRQFYTVLHKVSTEKVAHLLGEQRRASNAVTRPEGKSVECDGPMSE